MKALTRQASDNPKDVFQCDVADCNQKFVRLDLLLRHKNRHRSSPSYTPRNKIPCFDASMTGAKTGTDSTSVSSRPRPSRRNDNPNDHYNRPLPSSGGPHDATGLPTLTPDINAATTTETSGSTTWTSTLDDQPASNAYLHRQGTYGGNAAALSEPSAMVDLANLTHPAAIQRGRSSFAAWLFDPQTTCNNVRMAPLRFLDTMLESNLKNKTHCDGESLSRLPPLDVAVCQSDAFGECVTESRRQELLHWFQRFRKKQPQYDILMPNLVRESGGYPSALSLDMVRDCLCEFWDNVSPRLPVVHQHTFSPNRCPILLLLVIVSLGAASQRSRDATGRLSEHGAFADVIIASVRWEIATSDDSVPPIGLWVAQALLFLEFYEKMYSSRKFHERGHIYHSSFLALLRRGSPMIGTAGSESPLVRSTCADDIPLDVGTWWARWADAESMRRVVFVAFMLDILHAATFGHAADMAVHEIRLPLPCDDNLWTANNADLVRQLDGNFRTCRPRQVSFLDELKSVLHGKEVKTHPFGCMIILSGLLSVGWHLGHKMAHLKWLDLQTPEAEPLGSWRIMLLKALDSCETTFDVTVSHTVTGPDAARQRPLSNGPILSASLLLHLAHVSLYADIVDCQIYAGAKRLLGRKVSSIDYADAVKRMSSWAKRASTRHAILHAFRLLHSVLVSPCPSICSSPNSTSMYSLRNETDPHRPWILYYAVLSI
ncbi:hypothetical protein RJ55_00985 [Drechmeria coniospora]|nr:hypothetical protein RJ55_00985 [Drechmeria coniospora]